MMEEVFLLALAGSGRIFPWSALDNPGRQAEMIACQGNFIIPLDFRRLPKGRLHKISDMTHIISSNMKGKEASVGMRCRYYYGLLNLRI
ncbi:MAG: hypothetical protein AB1461_07930 [Thermodesulfobacteriota bacterium]